MGTLNDAAFEWLRNHHGIITIDQLEACDVPRAVVRGAVTNGTLIAVHRGVYRAAGQALTLESRCVALSAFQPRGFVTGPTGGRLVGLRRMPSRMKHLVDFAVPHGLRQDLVGVALRQSRTIEPTDVQVRADGIRIASPWRLAFDLAADLLPLDLESVIEQILAMRLCGLVTLAATAKRLARPARAGSQQFVTALAGRVPGGPLESHPEVQLAKALQAKGIPIAAQATWLDLPNGRRVRLDLSVPPIKWGLEVDVHPDHFLQQGTADRRRDRQCHRIGWQVDRVTAIDLLDLDALAAELLDVYRDRLREMTDGGVRAL